MNNMDKLKQLVLGVNATFHNVMMTPRIPHAESPVYQQQKLLNDHFLTRKVLVEQDRRLNDYPFLPWGDHNTHMIYTDNDRQKMMCYD